MTAPIAAFPGLLDLTAAGAGQIKFPSTQNPSADDNTFDDYRKKMLSFTPGISFGGGSSGMTFTSRFGSYVKLADAVLWKVDLLLSAKGTSTGAVLITGLPFTATNDFDTAIAIGHLDQLASITGQVMGFVAKNTSSIALNQLVSGSIATITQANFTNTSRLILSGWFPV